jgi:hypothetical protein
MKRCPCCGKEKARSEFNRAKARKDGLQSRCRACEAAVYANNKERVQARNKAWTEANKERMAVYRQDWQYQSQYGITYADFLSMCEAQGMRCAICGTSLTIEGATNNSKAVMDHCHDTGRTRGVLCSKCNRGLGLLNDDPAVLRAAAGYLEAHQ